MASPTGPHKPQTGQAMPVVRVPGPFRPWFGATEDQHEMGWRIEDTREMA